MKLTLKALAGALQRYSVRAGVVGGAITAAAATAQQFGLSVPPIALQVAGGLTAASVLGLSILKQANVDTYNPQTHTLVAIGTTAAAAAPSQGRADAAE